LKNRRFFKDRLFFLGLTFPSPLSTDCTSWYYSRERRDGVEVLSRGTHERILVEEARVMARVERKRFK
jgi:hypothetical protein